MHRLLSPDPALRPLATDTARDAYFQDTTLLTILYLQALVVCAQVYTLLSHSRIPTSHSSTFQEKDEVEKAEFFRGLPALLGNIPPRMLRTKVLAHLMDEISNPLQVCAFAQ